MSKTTLVIAAGSVLALAGVYFMSSSKSSSREILDIDDEDAIQPEEVIQIFERLFLELQSVLGQLMQQIQQLQMMGQQIPERQLKSLLKGEMMRALKAKQEVVLQEFNMDYDCLEEATWEFINEGNEKVKRTVERFQKLWENATGEEVVGYRPGHSMHDQPPAEVLSKDKLIEVAEKYFDSLTNAMRDLVNQYKAEGKNLKDPATQQQLNMDFAAEANDVGEAALEKEGTTLKQFEDSVKAHSNDPEVGRALGMMQMKQQQELMSIGA